MARKKKFDYFEAYEKLSDLAVRESELLLESFKSFDGASSLVGTLEAVHELEHQGDDINHDIFQSAAVDFMPPIDREDIAELAQALDNVLDNVEAVLQQVYMCDARVMPEDAVRFAKLVKKSCEALDKAMEDLDNVLDNVEAVLQQVYMCDARVMPEDAVRFAKLVKKSCEALDKAMEDFRNFKKSKAFKQLIVDVNTYEEEGDTLYLTAMRALHTQENPDVMHVLRWSRIYSRIEKCCDACEHAADVMNTILLKNL